MTVPGGFGNAHRKLAENGLSSRDSDSMRTRRRSPGSASEWGLRRETHLRRRGPARSDTSAANSVPARAYSFADATQVIANIEASHTSDQTVLSETLDIQPQAKILSDKSVSGDRRIRASLSGDVNIRYVALVENHVRRLLPRSGRQTRAPWVHSQRKISGSR
jgi:hypothetical protein